jgi:DNA-binding transcriptional LysR family regulator
MHIMNLNRIDLNLLVVFDAISQTRSVTLAAERLALSQPAVSHALGRLRASIGDPLFVRGRDGLTPTARAQAMIGSVAEILAEIGSLFSPREFDPATTTRVFRIGVSDYSTGAVLPELIRALRAAAPGVTLEAQPFGEHSLAQLETGGLDCSFWGGGPVKEPFRSHPLFRDRPVGLICGRHPLAKRANRGAVTLKDYLSYPHVLVTVGHITANPIDTALAAMGRTRRVAIATPGYSVNFALIVGTDLIMSPPARLAREAERLGLVTFELPVPVRHNAYALIWHRRTDADPANKWLRELIVSQHFREAGTPHDAGKRPTARRGRRVRGG